MQSNYSYQFVLLFLEQAYQLGVCEWGFCSFIQCKHWKGNKTEINRFPLSSPLMHSGTCRLQRLQSLPGKSKINKLSPSIPTALLFIWHTLWCVCSRIGVLLNPCCFIRSVSHFRSACGVCCRRTCGWYAFDTQTCLSLYMLLSI